MILPLDIFTLIIEELVATIPDLYYPLRDLPRRAFGGWIGDGIGDPKVADPSALKALKAICLTCRALVPFCQRELFATVRFESRPEAEKKWKIFAKLDQVLHQSPHLSEYVHNVYFADDSRDYPRSELISRVLSKLHNVRVLDLDEGCYSSGGNWRQFPHRTASAIGNMVKLPSVRILRISYIQEIPPEVVRRASQLRHLILYQCSFQSWPKSRHIDAAIEPPTVQLRAQNDAPQQTKLIPMVGSPNPSIVQRIVELPGLQTLAIDISSNEDVNYALELVKIAGGLSHLQWFIPPNGSFNGLSKVLSAGISQTLTTLTLTVRPLAQYGITEYPCCGLHLEIWLLPKQNVLRSLTFNFHYPLQPAFTRLEQFHEIDEAITHNRFPHLIEIRFHFILWNTGRHLISYDHSEWLQRYQSKFPFLSSNKDIDFRCSLEVSWNSG